MSLIIMTLIRSTSLFKVLLVLLVHCVRTGHSESHCMFCINL